ncbi:MAG: DUF1150 domain-containing protein [Rhodovulum sp.]|jgi:hypothetical protein|uniref:DUF1150 family protein n=1 Tax=Rhodovulum sp. FJ3 TaxID=3079053 RepID=UPI000C0B67D3|nr:DUF1150 family protein [Rhodovulum sp. FJ3]MAY31892.1 hypothetical protein [Rhodovulum sp.]MCI5086509.1 DUF1150 domain-containing protein [Rhodovulum sp.]MDV4167070.1 DUF1150 family protein [Rhodovulum sp. FJ3]MEC8630024.1 DUF1150 family protein [Pseudomonadota bacterium]|tara:strand:+ start:2423 stop:2665 length:243 start_codon:yes stop_codon:yes gene_type:complete
MDTTYDALPGTGESNIVYVRPVAVLDLPEDMQDEVREQVDGAENLYAVYDSTGERLALVKDRRVAFILARQNDLAPVSVH